MLHGAQHSRSAGAGVTVLTTPDKHPVHARITRRATRACLQLPAPVVVSRCIFTARPARAQRQQRQKTGTLLSACHSTRQVL